MSTFSVPASSNARSRHLRPFLSFSVPFAVKHLEASCGVMVTASHNTAQDNGYKVYWSNAIQIIPPHDAGIASSIETHDLSPLESWGTDHVRAHSMYEDRTDELKTLYFEHVPTLARNRSVIPPWCAELRPQDR